MRRIPFFSLAMAFILTGCGVHGRIDSLAGSGATVTLGLPYEDTPMHEMPSVVAGDTLEVEDMRSGETIIMKAVRDEDGEMVATDVINAAMVTARFRNVAERGGTVDIKFNISAPKSILDSDWQLRFTPKLIFENDSVFLERIFVTGEGFRRKQLRGYRRYERYLSGIIEDSSAFIWKRELAIFLSRSENNSELYRKVARDHYTDKLRKGINDRKILRKDIMFDRLVREPFCSSQLRLDTVYAKNSGDLVYEYVQTLTLDYTVRKFKLMMDADIHGIGEKLFSLPQSGPLTYYISSLSTLAVDVPQRENDSLYVNALNHLRCRRYRMAITDLAPYADFNAALAYAALNYNRKALEVLSGLEKQPKVDYLTALLLCRTGDELKALDCYRKACGADRSFIHRGNLDPEIRNLKNKYNLKD